MTSATTILKCVTCGRGQMQAEVDQANNIYLVCSEEKCGCRLSTVAATVILAERASKNADVGYIGTETIPSRKQAIE